MVLVCDIGNTNIVIGIYNDTWEHIWRIETDKNHTALHYSMLINEYLWEAGINPYEISFKSLSTVVPELKETFSEILQFLSPSPVVTVDKSIYNALPLKIVNPNEIGTDIVSNCLAAKSKFSGHILIIDFGTALTFTVMDPDGEILGVNIAPGIKIAIENLMSRTSQLPVVDIVFPENPLGTNTVEAIQNGVLIGYMGMIKHMISVVGNYLNIRPLTVATGGLSSILYPYIQEIDHIEPHLTLDGLRIAGEIYLKSCGTEPL